jgi:hypothetical protein
VKTEGKQSAKPCQIHPRYSSNVFQGTGAARAEVNVSICNYLKHNSSSPDHLPASAYMYIYGNNGIESDTTYPYKEDVEHTGTTLHLSLALTLMILAFQTFIPAPTTDQESLQLTKDTCVFDQGMKRCLETSLLGQVQFQLQCTVHSRRFTSTLMAFTTTQRARSEQHTAF